MCVSSSSTCHPNILLSVLFDLLCVFHTLKRIVILVYNTSQQSCAAVVPFVVVTLICTQHAAVSVNTFIYSRYVNLHYALIPIVSSSYLLRFASSSVRYAFCVKPLSLFFFCTLLVVSLPLRCGYRRWYTSSYIQHAILSTCLPLGR